MNRLLIIFFFSSVTEYLYFTSVAIFLDSIGFSALMISLAIGATALPNALLGPVFGRWVDRSPKKMLLLLLMFGLGLSQIAVLIAAGWFGGAAFNYIVLGLMIVFALAYSPYVTLFYQYLLPSLDENESNVYSLWELFSSASIVLASVLTFALLEWADPGFLILVSALSFMMNGAIVFALWKPKCGFGSDFVPSFLHFKETFRFIANTPSLFIGAIGMWVFAFSVQSLIDNIQVIGLGGLELPAKWVGLSMGVLAAMNWIGAWAYRSWFKGKYSNLLRAQAFILIGCLPALALFTVSLMNQWILVSVAAVCCLGMIEAFWTVNNTILLRANVPAGSYGEVYGIIRMPRALITALAVGFLGYTLDHHQTHFFFITSLAVLSLCALWNLRHRKQNKESVSKI